MPIRHFGPEEIQAGRRRLELSLFLTVLLANAMFALAEGHAVFLVVTVVTIGVHAVAAWRHTEIYAHRFVLNVSVLLVGLGLMARFFLASQDLLIALGHYVTLIQLCKLFERKADRDYYQMMVMSLLLVLAAAMMCQELLFAVAGLAYLVSLGYSAMAFTLKRNQDLAVRQQCGDADGRAGRQFAWPGRTVTARLAAIMLSVLATGLTVFLVCPRGLGGASPPLRRIRSEATSGFAETVRLGERRSIYLSDRVVMHVRQVSPDGAVLDGGATPYLRGRTFDEYVDSRWAKSRGRGLAWPEDPGADLLAGAVRQEVSMVGDLLPVAFASHPAVKISSPDAMVRRQDALEYELDAPPRAERPVRYTAWILPDGLTEQARRYLQREYRRWGPPLRVEGSASPATPAVARLARDWCQDLLARRAAMGEGPQRDDVDLDIARRLAGRLKERCSYTLDLSDVNSDLDGVEDFLLHLKKGHCEYFASAMTVMCQSLGVRARLAAGYCPSEFDAGQGHYVVRDRDAHAWTEVFTPRTDWVVVDATPEARLAPTAQSPLGRWWGWAGGVWHDWEFTWYAKVIGYDDETRRELAGKVRTRVLAAWRAVQAAGKAVGRGLVELLAHGRISPAVEWFFAGLAAAACGTAGLLIAAGRLRRRGGRGPRPRGPKPPAFLTDLLRLLRRRGYRPTSDLTAREWARQAADALAVPPETLQPMVDLYYRLRWSAHPVPRQELTAAEQQVRRLAEILST
jgi:transglutaminase-like putative cysteine protease